MVNTSMQPSWTAWLQTACQWQEPRFQYVTHGDRNVVERVFREGNRRTNRFLDTSAHVQPP